MTDLDLPPEAIDWVTRLHAVIDELAAPIVLAHGARLQCRAGCHSCCSDGLSVFALEAAVIARHHEALLASATPHEEGACAFLDASGACRIYAQRPYVCRTQGLPLRWLEKEDGETFEARDVCPLNVEGPPLEELPADQCWTLGPIEERLAQRQADGKRVTLRSLFALATSPPSSPASRRRLPIVR